jgi:deoxycytidylate deaminase
MESPSNPGWFKTLYSTTYPCTLCANKIAQIGINKVVYNEPYTMKEAEEIFKHSDIDTVKFEGVKSQAFFRLYGS